MTHGYYVLQAHTRHARGCPLLLPLVHRPLGPRLFAARAKGRSSALQEAPPEPDALRLLDTELHVEAETSYVAVRPQTMPA